MLPLLLNAVLGSINSSSEIPSACEIAGSLADISGYNYVFPDDFEAIMSLDQGTFGHEESVAIWIGLNIHVARDMDKLSMVLDKLKDLKVSMDYLQVTLRIPQGYFDLNDWIPKIGKSLNVACSARVLVGYVEVGNGGEGLNESLRNIESLGFLSYYKLDGLKSIQIKKNTQTKIDQMIDVDFILRGPHAFKASLVKIPEGDLLIGRRRLFNYAMKDFSLFKFPSIKEPECDEIYLDFEKEAFGEKFFFEETMKKFFDSFKELGENCLLKKAEIRYDGKFLSVHRSREPDIYGVDFDFNTKYQIQDSSGEENSWFVFTKL
jgi:hypothetical protein